MISNYEFSFRILRVYLKQKVYLGGKFYSMTKRGINRLGHGPL